VDIPSYGIDIWQALWYKWGCSEHFNYEDKIIAFGWAGARSYRFGLGWEERAQLAGQCFLESCVGNHLGGDTVTRCSECGEELREGVKFCPSCGARVVEVAGPRYCPECGAVIVESGDRFCPECGTSLSEGTFAEKDVPARILRVGPSPWERFKRWWQSLLWRLTPSEETKAALRNIGRVIIILVAMAAFYIVVGVALALLSQAVTQKWAFLGFISVFSTLIALALLWELFDSWVEPIAVGVALFVAQAVGGFFLADEWALQAALSAALVLGVYLARFFFLGDRIQVAFDRGRAVGQDEGRKEEQARWEVYLEAQAAEEASIASAVVVEAAEEDGEAFVLPPFTDGEGEW